MLCLRPKKMNCRLLYFYVFCYVLYFSVNAFLFKCIPKMRKRFVRSKKRRAYQNAGNCCFSSVICVFSAACVSAHAFLVPQAECATTSGMGVSKMRIRQCTQHKTFTKRIPQKTIALLVKQNRLNCCKTVSNCISDCDITCDKCITYRKYF